ncbi:PTS transporter subunit EIIC [Vibrio chagasii]|nr:PTS transporter subunit EIIC [Vibrio chagasii]
MSRKIFLSFQKLFQPYGASWWFSIRSNGKRLLFAVGVALGFTNNDGVAGLAAIAGYGIMTAAAGSGVKKKLVMGAIKSILVKIGGILVGVAAWAFNRFFRIQLPEYLGSSVSVLCQSSQVFLRYRSSNFTRLSAVWPPVGGAYSMPSDWAAHQNPQVAFGIYGNVERSLIPFGLHHVWNVPFFFEAGTCVNVAMFQTVPYLLPSC